VSPAAVLWDADGVLQRVPDGGEESMRPALEGRVEDLDACLEQAVLAERPALAGEVRWLDVLPGLLAEWDILDAYDDVVRLWLTIEPVDAARELVREVRSAGVACHLASNQDVHRASYMQERLGYADLLDGAFYSCALGAAKPDPAYFAAIVDRLGLPADRVLLVDDRASNVDAARDLGLAAETWSYREDPDVLRGHLVRHGVLA
jgi:putative hydrolase of the HAD superfamily